jgi:alpha-glucoside transport system permease protein
VSSRAIDAYQAGDTADLGDGETITVQPNGDYRWEGDEEQLSGRGATCLRDRRKRRRNSRSPITATSCSIPDSTDSMAKAFFNTLTVTIPATIIPIVIAAFAAYALAWMDFRAARC